MVTGNGPSHLNEFMATLNSPGLSQPSFSAIETDIGKWLHDVFLETFMYKRYDTGTFGLLSKLNFCEHP
jgi:hypothetical protein